MVSEMTRQLMCSAGLFILLGVGVLHAQDGPVGDSIDSLKGLRPIAVVVEDIPELRNVLSSSTLKMAADEKLRQNDVTVESDAGGLKALTPYVSVNVNVFRTSDGRYFIYNVRVSLRRMGSFYNPDSNSSNLIRAETWSRGSVGITGVSDSGPIRDTVTDLLDEFVDDYLAANPKR